jgi:hypothetical protein
MKNGYTLIYSGKRAIEFLPVRKIGEDNKY